MNVGVVLKAAISLSILERGQFMFLLNILLISTDAVLARLTALLSPRGLSASGNADSPRPV